MKLTKGAASERRPAGGPSISGLKGWSVINASGRRPAASAHLLWRLFEEFIRKGQQGRGRELRRPNVPTCNPLCFGFFH